MSDQLNCNEWFTYLVLEHGRDTSTEVEMGDVYQEVDETMSKLRVGMHKIKPCIRKYAFELPGIPKEAEYLKLMYPYDSKCHDHIYM